MGYFDITTTVLPLPSDPRNKDTLPRDDLTAAEIPGYWVEIKDDLNFGDTNYRAGKVVTLQSTGAATDAKDAVAKWELQAFATATLERAIVAWNLTEGEGRQAAVLPVKPDTINLLRQRDAAFILAEVLKRNPNSDEAGKVNGSDSTTKPSTAEPDRSTKLPA